jgi:hypothetical protein
MQRQKRLHRNRRDIVNGCAWKAPTIPMPISRVSSGIGSCAPQRFWRTRRVQTGGLANWLIKNGLCRARPPRSRADGGRSGRLQTGASGRGCPGGTKQAWVGAPLWGAECQEPTGLPCIVLAAGRPFPPPRARPVISGVVDLVGYAPVFSAASTGVYGSGAERNFRSKPGFKLSRTFRFGRSRK